MKRFILFNIIVFVFISNLLAQQKFLVNLNDRADDLFKVTLLPQGLDSSNDIFQFAATAPGTYQTMDIGRFVRSFKAYDASGDDLTVQNISTNQWQIKDPQKAAKIIYTIAETWDTPVDKNSIYAMSGTSLESDNAVINGQAVFGYFHGKQQDSIYIKLEYPSDWLVGTALTKNNNGFFAAKNYDEVVDSPIMLGKLTKSTEQIENTKVDIYCYSKTGKISSEILMMALEDIMEATNQFTDGLPVDHYTFLFHFENFAAGAWEHNYSSFYVFAETDMNEMLIKELKSIAAHEFYHIITPLNIHSELVSNFNFERPTMSQHIWFYEGVTEWASDILQLREYLISLDDYLKEVRTKLLMNDNFDQSISLTDLSIHSTEKQDQYPNIYQKGALVAMLLDIRLLELSNGTKGLREIINQLYKDYGVNKAFDENNFFNEFVNRTYPEISDFIKKYIQGTEKLPVKEYFQKLGIDYKEFSGFDSTRIALGFGIGLKDQKLIITRVDDVKENSLIAGDVISKVNGEEVDLKNAQSKFGFMMKMKVGETFNLTILRDGYEKEVTIVVQPRSIKHTFTVEENPAEEQKLLRSAWMKNF